MQKRAWDVLGALVFMVAMNAVPLGLLILGIHISPSVPSWSMYLLWLLGLFVAIGLVALPMLGLKDLMRESELAMSWAIGGAIGVMILQAWIVPFLQPVRIAEVSLGAEALKAVEEGCTHLLLEAPVVHTDKALRYTETVTQKRDIGSRRVEVAFFVCPVSATKSEVGPFAIWVRDRRAHDLAGFKDRVLTGAKAFKVAWHSGADRAAALGSPLATKQVVVVEALESFASDRSAVGRRFWIVMALINGAFGLAMVITLRGPGELAKS